MGAGLKRAAAQSLRWSAASKFGSQLLNWAITIVVVRLLSPSDYGLLAMANIFIGLFSMVSELGFGASIVQAGELEALRIRKLFGAALILNFGIFVALALAAWPIAHFYAEPRLTRVIQVSALQFIIGATAVVPSALLTRALRLKRLSVLGAIGSLTGSATTLALAYSGFGVWSLVLGGLAGAVAGTTLLQMFAPQRMWPSFRVSGIRDLVSFGAQITLIRILAYAFVQADVIIASKAFSVHVLGTYSVAVHLATLPMQRLSSIFNGVAFPAFARLGEDVRAISVNLLLVVRLISFIAFPILWGISSVAPELVRLALGPTWTGAILPIQIIATIIPLRMVNSIVNTVFISRGYAQLMLKVGIANLLLAATLFYVGVQHGIIGLSVAWVVLTPAVSYISLRQTLAKLGTKTAGILHEMAPSAACALFMVVGVLAVRGATENSADLSRFAILVMTGAILYALATLVINRTCAVEAAELLLPGLVSAIRRKRAM
ncbi:MAG: lipopolysaccharide biosynthesis protein [Casimicrobiaceae bacterium]